MDFFETLMQSLSTLHSRQRSVRPDPEVMNLFMNKTSPRKTQESFSAADNSGMDGLRRAIAVCQGCRLTKVKINNVPGEGPDRARLMFIGEVPGMEEDKTGRPFSGVAGDKLTQMINAMQFSREEVYLSMALKCRTPYNRDPQPDEIGCCREFLLREIELVNPEVIVLFGDLPLRMLNLGDKVEKCRGRWLAYKEFAVLSTYSPAHILHNEKDKLNTWRDLQMAMKQLGKEVKAKQ